jgi:hypothetical protein
VTDVSPDLGFGAALVLAMPSSLITYLYFFFAPSN